jgi:hypothetical protein
VKTHLLVLEAHDDLVSVRDRMSWAKTPRILLVWPVGVRVNLRPVDLKLLDRQARSLGARLGLMTRDRAVQREAAALGLPVFRSTAAAQRDHWPAPVKRTFRRRTRVNLRALQKSARPAEAKWKSSLPARILFFAFGALAVLSVVGVFVPRAQITLSPETKIQRVIIPVVADPALDIVFITGSIPAREFTREISGKQKIPATGAISVPKSEAEGVARFGNLTNAPVQIPAGTIIQTRDAPPVRFMTLQDTQVAAGIGKFVEAPIRSVEAGGRGNQEAETIRAIEGPLGLSLTVTNPSPTTGGTDRKILAPTAEDRERLRNELIAPRSHVVDSSEDVLPEGSFELPDTIQVGQVLEETYDPPAGQPGDALTLFVRYTLTMRYVDQADLMELASLALDASMEAGFAVVPDSLTVEPVPPFVTVEDGRTSFNVKAERRLVRSVDTQRILSLVKGRQPDAAHSKLTQLPGLASPPQITLVPNWWPWLPLAPFRIDVVIE